MNKIHTILLPGWGVSANIFNTLPDYDAAQKIDLLTLQGVHHDEYWLIKSLDKQIKKNQPLCIIGWSLGGLLATHYAACYPNQVQQLILLNSNPCFIRQHNWPGMAPFHFKTFFDQFNAEPRRTLKRFHNLCAKQDQSNKQKTIYHQLLRYQTIIPIQHSTEHQHWMRLLNYLSEDRRHLLDSIQCPVLHILSQQDHLVPFQVAQTLQTRYPTHQITACPGSHAFFLDNKTLVSTIIQKWNTNKKIEHLIT